MTLLIGFLTFILVMNCLFLMLLILIQLPKKEAGAGIAFGGAATDALFGAGSGNALTKMTKYTASIFVGLSVLLSVLNMQASRQGTRRLEQELSRQANTSAPRSAAVPKNVTTQPVAAAQTTPMPAAPQTTLQVSTNVFTSPPLTLPANPAPAPTAEAPATQPAPAPATPK
jgi:protein translocase SecG subunit